MRLFGCRLFAVLPRDLRVVVGGRIVFISYKVAIIFVLDAPLFFIDLIDLRRLALFAVGFRICIRIVSAGCRKVLLVFGFGMKVEGVAIGTLTAQYAGFLMAVVMCLKGYGRLRRHFSWHGVWQRSAMSHFFSVNRDIFVRTLCMVSVMLFFTSAGSWQGEVVLAVNTLLMQFYLLFSYVMDGFAYAGEALAGRYYGARNGAALRSTVGHLFLWGLGMAVAFTAVYGFGGDAFLSLLTDEPSVVAASHTYYYWALAIPLAGMAAFVWDGVFIGCTMTRGMLVSMALAAATFFILYYALRGSLANHGLWIAFIAYMAVRGLAQTFIFRKARLTAQTA